MWLNITWNFEFIISQIFVLFAVVSLALSCCTKNRFLILILSLLNAIFYGIHYLFLKEYSGAFLNFIGVVRAVWFFVNDKFKVRKNYTLISLFVCLALLIATEIYTFDKWYSILPLIATIIYTVAVWQKNVKIYRWALIPTEIIAVVYNIMCGSLFGVIFEGTLLIVAIVSVIKIYSQNKNLPLEETVAEVNEKSQNKDKEDKN